MKVAALYSRVSSAKQRLNENIASQIAAIQEYARQNDFQISPQHVYKDDGFSFLSLHFHKMENSRKPGN
jgi:site-specific DNA recombinase